MVGTGESAVDASQVVTGTGNSSALAWTSTVKLTGTRYYESRTQLMDAISAQGLYYRDIEVLPFALDTSEATNLDVLFDSFTSLREIPAIDTSKVESATRMFWGCSSLLELPELDFSRMENLGNVAFRNASSLRRIPLVGLTSPLHIEDTALTPENADETMRLLGSSSSTIHLPGASAGCNPLIAEEKGWSVTPPEGTVFDFTTPGDYEFDRPSWATHIDQYIVGGGGGGASGGLFSGNGNGGYSGDIRFRSSELTSSTNDLMDFLVARVGAGGSGGQSNNNASGSSGDQSWIFPFHNGSGGYSGWSAAGGGGGSGTGNRNGEGNETMTGFSNTFMGAGTAGRNVDGRTPGGGGGGGNTGGLIGGGGNPGRSGGDGRVWIRLRGGGN